MEQLNQITTINELESISTTALALTTFLSVVDVSSDFVQGIFLYLDENLAPYGLVTIFINWIPGLIASVHLITYQRHQLGIKRTLYWCGKF